MWCRWLVEGCRWNSFLASWPVNLMTSFVTTGMVCSQMFSTLIYIDNYGASGGPSVNMFCWWFFFLCFFGLSIFCHLSSEVTRHQTLPRVTPNVSRSFWVLSPRIWQSKYFKMWGSFWQLYDLGSNISGQGPSAIRESDTLDTFKRRLNSLPNPPQHIINARLPTQWPPKSSVWFQSWPLCIK